MNGIYGMVAFGALFKKKKEPAGISDERARDRETEIRKRLVDDLRGREDALRQREAAVVFREEELERGRAELARRLQELAARPHPQNVAPDVAGHAAAPAPSPGQAQSIRDLEKQMKVLEEQLEKVRAVHRELATQEKKKGEYLERLISYKTRGFSVGKLETIIGKGPEETEKAFRAFQKDIDTLVALAARCDRVDPVYSREAEALKALCTRPEAIGEVEKGIKELEAKERAKKKLLMDRVGKWRSEGFFTQRFDRLEVAPLGDLEEAVLQFDVELGVLRKLGKRLEMLGESYASDASTLRPLLNDPGRIGELEGALSRLEKGPPGSVLEPSVQDAGATDPGQPTPSPVLDKNEEEVKGMIAETEKMIAGLNASGTDPTAAENLLRMAKSFTRSKNFPKALEYARKAQQAAIELRK
jgi:hypothetical protein